MDLKYIICEAEQNNEISIDTRDELLNILEADEGESKPKYKKNAADRAADKYGKDKMVDLSTARGKQKLQKTMLSAQKDDRRSGKAAVNEAVNDWKRAVNATYQKYARQMNNVDVTLSKDEYTQKRKDIYEAFAAELNEDLGNLLSDLYTISKHLNNSDAAIKQTIADIKENAKAAHAEMIEDWKGACSNAAKKVKAAPGYALAKVKGAPGALAGLFKKKNKEEVQAEATEIRCSIYDAELNGTITVTERTLLISELDKKVEEIMESTDDDETESPDFDQLYEMING
jgi:hypothetical protein